MSILAAIRREEKKVKKQLAKLQIDLIGLQSAAKALGKSANKDLTKAKKRVRRVLSAAGRAKISRAAKKRWAKIRAQAKKAVA
jgi:phage-related minor tail protein